MEDSFSHPNDQAGTPYWQSYAASIPVGDLNRTSSYVPLPGGPASPFTSETSNPGQPPSAHYIYDPWPAYATEISPHGVEFPVVYAPEMRSVEALGHSQAVLTSDGQPVSQAQHQAEYYEIPRQNWEHIPSFASTGYAEAQIHPIDPHDVSTDQGRHSQYELPVAQTDIPHHIHGYGVMPAVHANPPVLVHPLIAYRGSRSGANTTMPLLWDISLPPSAACLVPDLYGNVSSGWMCESALEPPTVDSMIIRIPSANKTVIVSPAHMKDPILIVDVIRAVHWAMRTPTTTGFANARLPLSGEYGDIAVAVDAVRSPQYWGGLYQSPDEENAWILQLYGPRGYY